MLDIIGKKNWYFLISFLIILPGVVSLFLWGLNPSIDFTGGSRTSLVFKKDVSDSTLKNLRDVYIKENIEIGTLQTAGKTIFVRTTPITTEKNAKIITALQKKIGEFKQEEFETVGPVIGQEITLNALKAIVLASLLIVLYIAWSFRSVPKPTSSWRFGICAVIALIHDALVLIGIFSLLGHFFHVEVDSLFVTAVLTVIGFSVHDTIVVFDRIRENLQRTSGLSFAQIVNDSILQTFTRSLNTSLTAILVLFALLLFGGGTIHWFVVALLIGIASGTYSSIFNAAALLVAWQEFDDKKRKKK